MDAISSFIDCDDWGVSLHFSTHVNVIWGPHSVNGFVNSHNFKPTSFYSRYWNVDCEGVDASCYDWVWENNWLVLLVFLIPRELGILSIVKLQVLLSYPSGSRPVLSHALPVRVFLPPSTVMYRFHRSI